jgi:hypothetical protein
MKLNDPFGRVGRRQQAGYAAVKSQLLAEGISTVAAVEATARRITRSALLFALVVSGLSVLVAGLVPAWRGLTGVFAGLALIWIGATFARTRLHLKRFRAELNGAGAARPTAEPDNNTSTGGNP